MRADERRESDLAGPVRDYLLQQGYIVRSEVKDCDLTALHEDQLIVVELKRGFTMDLLLQATERQRVADAVYVAIPAACLQRERRARRWQGMERLLKRLELGLIVVHFSEGDSGTTWVEVPLHPMPPTKLRQRSRQRQVILREIAARSEDYNTAGTTRQPLLTAYREQAICIAFHLQMAGPQTPTALCRRGCSPRTQKILHRNVYGWFERQKRGVYAVRPEVCNQICTQWPAFSQRCQEAIKPDTQ
jgi:hypothetical protein